MGNVLFQGGGEWRKQINRFLTLDCPLVLDLRIMAAADEYIPCLKCDAWVPHYAKEIHMAECHELTLKQFTHPYINGKL